MANISKNIRIITLLFIILISLYSNYVFAIGIGTIPGVLDLGTVKRGQEVVGEFYITSTLESPMKLILNYVAPHATIYSKEKTRDKNGYELKPEEVSEEDISDWIEFLDKELIIDPNEKKVINLPNGQSIIYNNKFRFVIKIPEDAEPGYHVGSINMYVRPTKDNAEGTKISTIGITRPIFVFKVSGNAVRDGRIIGIETKRLSDKEVRVDVLFKNEGTVTITATFEELEIYDDFGYKTGNIAVRTSKKVAPGEIVVLHAYWRDNEGIKSGSYKAYAKVDYRTSYAEYQGYIKVLDTIYVPKEAQAVKKESTSIPWWFLLIILGLIALYIYWKM